MMVHPEGCAPDVGRAPRFDLGFEEQQLPERRLVQLALEGHLARLLHPGLYGGRTKVEAGAGKR